MLQWARAQGCPWHEWTCAHAADGSHLVVLQWLRAEGCPWDENTCYFAALRGNHAVLQWARDHSPFGPNRLRNGQMEGAGVSLAMSRALRC